LTKPFNFKHQVSRFCTQALKFPETSPIYKMSALLIISLNFLVPIHLQENAITCTIPNEQKTHHYMGSLLSHNRTNSSRPKM